MFNENGDECAACFVECFLWIDLHHKMFVLNEFRVTDDGILVLYVVGGSNCRRDYIWQKQTHIGYLYKEHYNDVHL